MHVWHDFPTPSRYHVGDYFPNASSCSIISSVNAYAKSNAS